MERRMFFSSGLAALVMVSALAILQLNLPQMSWTVPNRSSRGFSTPRLYRVLRSRALRQVVFLPYNLYLDMGESMSGC